VSLLKKNTISKLQLYDCNDREKRWHLVQNQHQKKRSGQVQEKYHGFGSYIRGEEETKGRSPPDPREALCSSTDWVTPLSDGARLQTLLLLTRAGGHPDHPPCETSFGAAPAAPKNFFTLRVTEPWNRLPREVVESPSLEIFKTCPDEVLCSLL